MLASIGTLSDTERMADEQTRGEYMTTPKNDAERDAPSAGSRPLTIAIDYDDTFDAAALMWTEFIKTATKHGHTVVCITARRKTFDNMKELRDTLPKEVDAHFSYDEPKADYARRNGIAVDIWIDDRPGWIVGIM